MTHPEQPPFDPLNTLLAEVPSTLTTGVISVLGAQRLGLTIRTGSTTLTVLLTKDDVRVWRDQLSAEHGKMTGLILPPNGIVQ